MQISYNQLLQKFPEVAQDLVDVGNWLKSKPQEIIYQYQVVDIDRYIETVSGMLSSYDLFPEEKDRTDKIINEIADTDRVLPIFVDNEDDFILEGRHRIVAFYQLGHKQIPAVYCLTK